MIRILTEGRQACLSCWDQSQAHNLASKSFLGRGIQTVIVSTIVFGILFVNYLFACQRKCILPTRPHIFTD